MLVGMNWPKVQVNGVRGIGEEIQPNARAPLGLVAGERRHVTIKAYPGSQLHPLERLDRDLRVATPIVPVEIRHGLDRPVHTRRIDQLEVLVPRRVRVQRPDLSLY